MKNEIWKDIPGYENIYQVSDLGNIRKWFKKPRTGIAEWKVLISSFDKRGYKRYSFSLNKVRKTWQIHRLVLFVFNPIEDMEIYQVNHIDGNKINNSITNLEWCTAKENVNHAYNIGLYPYGMNHSRCKLSDEQVDEIRELRKTTSLTYKQIGKLYNVSDSHIGYIIGGQTRKRISIVTP